FPGGGTGTLSGAQILNVSAASFTMVINFNGNPGSYGIRVNNPNGGQSGVFSFTVNPVDNFDPVIRGISPASPVATRGNQNVTVNGSNFLSGLTVTVFFPSGSTGTLSGAQIQNVTATSFTMVIDFNGNPGSYGIRVNNPNNRQSTTFNFTAQPVPLDPVIIGITPSSPIATRGDQNVQVNGNNFQSGLSVTAFFPSGGARVLSGTQIRNLSSMSFTLVIDFNGNPGSYSIQVSNPNGRLSNQFGFTVSAEPTCSLPAITQQPNSAVFNGAPVTLSVAASSATTLAYQWYLGTKGDTTSPVAGATSASLTITQPFSTASYWARVSNTCGSVNSNAAVITVNTPGNLEVEVIDPACSTSVSCMGAFLVESGNTVSLHPDARELAKASVVRTGAVTDGVTRLLLRVRSAVPVTFSLRAPVAGPGFNWGVLMKRDGSAQGSSVQVAPENGLAFAVYLPPKDFPGVSAKESPIITIEATSAAGSGRASITLRPPPVVLVHGVWSSGLAWGGLELYLSRQHGFIGRNIVRTDYGSVNPAGAFDPDSTTLAANDPVKKLIDSTGEALNSYRDSGIAVTQVDVIGHSMGGLVARSRAASKAIAYLRKDNYRQGDFHKLITVGTPHHGSPLANLLVQRRCDNFYNFGGQRRRTVQELFERELRMPLGPAIFGFQTSSSARQHIG
ncbi:MAG: alpha/beta fold hydrolase, partial [Blastocatellia bacterium]